MQNLNLNHEELRAVDSHSHVRAKTLSSVTGDIQVFFDDLEDYLIEQINKAEAVFGCVAWLTNERILKALSQKMYVQIVVQKEDFLRPDLFHLPRHKADLRKQYDDLVCNLGWYEFPRFNDLSYCGCDYESVRCVGNYNADKKPAHPRMHHKFVVFANAPYYDIPECRVIEPYAVWTGSFNFTYNASMSLENALLITDALVVKAYLEEYKHVFALSEPLDWESQWVSPEFRIGS